MNSFLQSTPAAGAVANYIAALKNFSNVKGRARRSEYWHFVLINFAISFVLSFTIGLVLPTVAGIINLIYNLAILVPAVTLCIRRMHDVDKSGWFALSPLYNFMLAITEGTRGSNQYGPDPKTQTMPQAAGSVA